MKEIFKRWWEGTYVPAPKDDPNSSVFIIAFGTYQKSASSRVAHALVDFWLKYWQWCIGIMVALFLGLRR